MVHSIVGYMPKSMTTLTGYTNHDCEACADLSPIETELVAQARFVREMWNVAVENDFVDRLAYAVEHDPRTVRWDEAIPD